MSAPACPECGTTSREHDSECSVGDWIRRQLAVAPAELTDEQRRRIARLLTPPAP